MSSADADLVRRSMQRWIDLVAARDIDGLQAYLDEFYAPDAWIDFGTRTPDALPGHGVQIIVDWARDALAEWDHETEFRYEILDVVDTGAGIAVPARSVGRLHGHELEVRFTYLFRVRDRKIVWMTMYSTLDEALAAATDVTGT